jgi:hypothetical protein
MSIGWDMSIGLDIPTGLDMSIDLDMKSGSGLAPLLVFQARAEHFPRKGRPEPALRAVPRKNTRSNIRQRQNANNFPTLMWSPEQRLYCPIIRYGRLRNFPNELE